MGSATRGALATARRALDSLGTALDVSVGEQLLQAGRVIGGSGPLRAALADPSAEPGAKKGVIAAVFSGFGTEARTVLDAVAEGRWSDDDQLLGGIEELGIRALADSAPDDVTVEAQLFTVRVAIASDAELELAVGSKLGAVEQKLALVDRLLAAKLSPQALAIVRHLVQQPRGRSMRESLRKSAAIVADQAGRAIVTVTSAAPLAVAQVERLESSLQARYGRPVRINLLVDPGLIGGLRVQIGDDVIDGTVASKLNDLKLQLAG